MELLLLSYEIFITAKKKEMSLNLFSQLIPKAKNDWNYIQLKHLF